MQELLEEMRDNIDRYEKDNFDLKTKCNEISSTFKDKDN
jgi:hypothetical protein